jgi:hypothetical protein
MKIGGGGIKFKLKLFMFKILFYAYFPYSASGATRNVYVKMRASIFPTQGQASWLDNGAHVP